MASSPAIGIDLGTTNTVAAIYVDGIPIIIPNTQGGRVTPSVVFYDPKNLKAVVGSVAEDQSLRCPENYMFDMKRLIGRNYHDVNVQSFIQLEETKSKPIHIIRSLNEQPVVKLETTSDSLKFTEEMTKSPEETSSEILRYIKQSVQEHLGFDVTDAVISVPAYFSYAQRAATKRAAKAVGYNVLKLITEPVAAAIHYTFGKSRTEENLLMFDLGGGTLDVSIISIRENTFNVRSIEGDMFLGGSDFDEILFEYLRIEVGRKYGNKYINQDERKGRLLLHRLRKTAKRFKEMLSTLTEYSISIDVDVDIVFDVTITREVFEKLSDELLKRILDKVKQCLQTADMSPTDINKVVLVGGSSRIPTIRNSLSKMFAHIKLSTDINPDEAVALGASIHAALLKDQIETRERYNIVEMAPFSVGILAKYNLMVDFIKKGTALPAQAKQIMHTTENDQKTTDFAIYEGERKQCQHNNKLGMFSITDLPPGKLGDVEFDVTFHLDEDGLLRVTAIEKSTGTSRNLQIEMENLTLCCNRKFVSLEEENELLADDEIYDKFCRLKLEAETFCKSLLYHLEYANLRNQQIIKQQCDQFLLHIRSLDYHDIDLLEMHYQGMQRRVRTTFHEAGRELNFELF